MDTLVSTQWLADAQERVEKICVIDASMHMPQTGRNARQEFEQGHIPGSVFFDIQEIADQDNPIPLMLPSLEKFASRMMAIGLTDGVQVVVYDDSDLKTSARAWWMLHVFGVHRVSILDGGLRKWKAEGRPLESGSPVIDQHHLTVRKDHSLVRDLEQMKKNLTTKAEQVIDTRSSDRFAGMDPEPRSGVRAGHIPGSVNMPYKDLFDEKGCWKSVEEIRSLVARLGIDINKSIIATCGSGITACTASFALHRAGCDQIAVYDGSFAEWGTQADTSVITGV